MSSRWCQYWFRSASVSSIVQLWSRKIDFNIFLPLGDQVKSATSTPPQRRQTRRQRSWKSELPNYTSLSSSRSDRRQELGLMGCWSRVESPKISSFVKRSIRECTTLPGTARSNRCDSRCRQLGIARCHAVIDVFRQRPPAWEVWTCDLVFMTPLSLNNAAASTPGETAFALECAVDMARPYIGCTGRHICYQPIPPFSGV